MGKRRNSIIASILIISSLAVGYVARNVSSDQVISSIQGAEVRAQEVNPNKAFTKSSFVGDAFGERAIIVKNSANAGKNFKVMVTAYQSDIGQTDNTPFNTANGTKVHDGVAAANFLPFGTKFKLPEIYGERVFTVEDRMNSRYNNQKIVDIWMTARKDAVIFGKQKLTLELL